MYIVRVIEFTNLIRAFPVGQPQTLPRTGVFRTYLDNLAVESGGILQSVANGGFTNLPSTGRGVRSLRK